MHYAQYQCVHSMVMMEIILAYNIEKALHMLCLAVIDQCEVGASMSFICDDSPGGTTFTKRGTIH